eukprot:Sdes_comp10148_c0_seq1m1761
MVSGEIFKLISGCRKAQSSHNVKTLATTYLSRLQSTSLRYSFLQPRSFHSCRHHAKLPVDMNPPKDAAQNPHHPQNPPSEAAAESQPPESSFEDSLKQKILASSLAHVHLRGWSRAALAEGAKENGYVPITQGLFPRGGVELAEYYVAQSNLNILKQFSAADLSSLKTSEIIREAITMRLRLTIPYVNRWHEALALMALPSNVSYSFVSMATFADEIWHLAGDKSTDLNWYTKRALFLGVYSLTELYMIQDQSSDFESTWGFLDRKLDNIAWLAVNVKHLDACAEQVFHLIKGFSTTVKNMSGPGPFR